MKKVIVTSKNIDGQLIFGFNSTGVMVLFENQAQLTDEQLKYLATHWPLREEYMNIAFGKCKIQDVTDYTFEAFWDKYDYKVGNKKRAEKLWNELKLADKLRIFDHLPRYKYYLKMKGINQLYAETFLHQKRWENELPK